MNKILTDIKVGYFAEKNKKELALFIIASATMAAWFSISISNGYFSGECVDARAAIQSVLS